MEEKTIISKAYCVHFKFIRTNVLKILFNELNKDDIVLLKGSSKVLLEYILDLMYGTRSYAPRRNGNKGHDVEDIYTYSETEAFFQNIKGESVEIPFFEEYVENGKKAIIKVNINPNSFDPDCESEFKYWVEDCKRVISDDTIDERTKILTIPKRFFHISVGNKKYLIDGCQIVKDFSDKKYPFNYAILVEKIERICK